MRKRNLKELKTKGKSLSYFFKKEKSLTFLIVFFGFTFNVSQIFSPILLGNLIDTIASESPYKEILKYTGIYLGVITIIQVLRFFKRYLVRLFAKRTSRTMRKMIFDSTLNSSLSEIESHTIGDLMSRCIGDVDYTVEGIRKSLTEIFDTGVLMTSYFVTLMIYDFKTTLIASFFIPLSILFAYLLKGKIYRYNREYREYASRVNNETFEMVSHTKEYRIYDSMDTVLKEYDSSINDLKKKAIHASYLDSSMEPMYKAIGSLGIFFVILFGAFHVKNGDSYFMGVWTIGAFTAYLKLFVSFTKKASKVSKLFNTVEKALVSYNRIEDFLEDKKPMEEKIALDRGALVFDKVSCVLPDGTDLFKDISFTAKPGEIIGITGPVGCGKTTLGEISSGIREYEGKITLAGKNLKKYSKEEKSTLISYMGHKSYLLSDTIENNILLGDKGNTDTVLSDVAFSCDLSRMPLGKNTIVGAGGVKLSGGQGQRISLARTLYRKNNLIILDDPFSASDSVTEEAIISSIRKNYKDSIILLISHRLTAFPLTDSVLFLNKESSLFLPHEEMVKKSPLYKEIYEIQKGGIIHD